MALNNLPLNDAGGDYYARQFGNRIQNIRKYGATPPTQRKAGCLGSGGAVGGGIFAVIVLIRIIAAVAWIGSSNSDSNYNTYDPPNITIPDPPPPIDWQNNVQVDPPMDPNAPNGNPPLWQPGQPIILPPLDPPPAQPDDPLIRPDPPGVIVPDQPPAVPDPNPPAIPGDDKPGGDDR